MFAAAVAAVAGSTAVPAAVDSAMDAGKAAAASVAAVSTAAAAAAAAATAAREAYHNVAERSDVSIGAGRMCFRGRALVKARTAASQARMKCAAFPCDTLCMQAHGCAAVLACQKVATV